MRLWLKRVKKKNRSWSLRKFCRPGRAFVAVSHLRKDPATQHIPVLGYSAAQDPEQQLHAREAGISLLAGNAAISEHLPRLLDQVLQVE